MPQPGCDAVVSVDLLDLKLFPRNIQLGLGQKVGFQSVRDAGRVSCPFLEVVRSSAVASTLSSKQDVPELVISEGGDDVVWSYSGRLLPTAAVSISSATEGAAASGSAAPAGGAVWTAMEPGFFSFRSELYPFIRGVITVLEQVGVDSAACRCAPFCRS